MSNIFRTVPCFSVACLAYSVPYIRMLRYATCRVSFCYGYREALFYKGGRVDVVTLFLPKCALPLYFHVCCVMLHAVMLFIFLLSCVSVHCIIMHGCVEPPT